MKIVILLQHKQDNFSSPMLILALKNVLSSKDERCVTDALRLCDLIVILLCEGRSALPKHTESALIVKNEPGEIVKFL